MSLSKEALSLTCHHVIRLPGLKPAPVFRKLPSPRRWVLLSLALTGFVAQGAEPFSFQAGPVNVYPLLKIEESYNDNIYLQSDNEQDSFVTVVTPGVLLEALSGDNEYQLGYRLSNGSFSSAHVEDYTDHFVNGRASWVLTRRNSLELQGKFEAGHEERGTGTLQGPEVAPSEEPFEYDHTAGSLAYTYGTKESDGRLTFKLGGGEIEYTNRRDITRLRDRSNLDLGANFYWRIGGRTGLVFDVQNIQTRYAEEPAPSEDARGTKDSDYFRYLAGIAWEATDITKASFKLGWAEKNFDSGRRDDFSGLSWETLVDWAFKPYSKLRLSIERKAEESYGRGDFVDEKSAQLLWSHDWNTRVTSKVAYGLTRDTYENDPEAREDDTQEAMLGLEYAFREWLSCGISWKLRDRESTLDSYSFTRNLATIHVSAGF